MFKTNEYYVKDIITNLDFIIDHMLGKTKEELEQDEVLTDSMVFRLIQISEISKNLSDEFKDEHSDISWNDITALRNRLVHDYGNVDMSIVFDTLTKDIPELKKQIEKVL